MNVTLVFLLGAAAMASAQYPAYPGCGDLKDSDFRESRLLTRAEDPTMDEPMRMDFHTDDRGNVNIYFIERRGALKYFDAAAKSMRVVGRLDVLYAEESGLLGIALDPAFKSNRWIYLYWSPLNVKTFRLSRFTILPGNTLDPASEKVVLDIPDTRKGINVHIGGAIQFDAQGNLWVATGEHDHTNDAPSYYHNTTDKESSDEDESTDTFSLYGSMLRIHPESDGTYTIPKGNFGEFWSARFRQQGRNVLAGKYADPKLVRPEVYVKGFRNAMSVQIDAPTGWAVVADCGGQCHKIQATHYCPADGKSEKTMLITEPGFHGWSYFHADNHPYSMDKAGEKNPLAPVNNSPFRLGVDTLPPAVPATYVYGLPKTLLVNNWICSVGGFMYRYDAKNPSPIKLPPHFEGRFFMSDMNQSFIRSIEVDARGAFVKASGDLFTSFMTRSHTLDWRQGPDGALYRLNYAAFQYTKDATTGIFRIEYTGDCKPVALKAPRLERPAVRFQGRTLALTGDGPHWFAVYDMRGSKVYGRTGSGPAEYALDLPDGVYFLKTQVPGSERKMVLAQRP